jgi:hypothetical protein
MLASCAMVVGFNFFPTDFVFLWCAKVVNTLVSKNRVKGLVSLRYFLAQRYTFFCDNVSSDC